jgi:hypothetical protein
MVRELRFLDAPAENGINVEKTGDLKNPNPNKTPIPSSHPSWDSRSGRPRVRPLDAPLALMSFAALRVPWMKKEVRSYKTSKT